MKTHISISLISGCHTLIPISTIIEAHPVYHLPSADTVSITSGFHYDGGNYKYGRNYKTVCIREADVETEITLVEFNTAEAAANAELKVTHDALYAKARSVIRRANSERLYVMDSYESLVDRLAVTTTH